MYKVETSGTLAGNLSSQKGFSGLKKHDYREK